MMGLTDFNLTPKAKKGLKDAKKFAEANGHSLVTCPHLIYGCLLNLSDSCSLKLKGYGVLLDDKKFIDIFKEYASKNPEKFESTKGQGAWHQEVNEIIFFAKEFSDNHKETRAVVVEAEAKIERMARKFEDFAGDFKIFKEVILDLIKERNRK